VQLLATERPVRGVVHYNLAQQADNSKQHVACRQKMHMKGSQVTIETASLLKHKVVEAISPCSSNAGVSLFFFVCFAIV
jgi:hypothetical protein